MKKWLILLALPLVLALTGCSASNMSAIEEQDDGSRATYLKSNNSVLYSRLGVRDPKMANAGDLLRAQATLENRWKFKLDFQYKIKWFSADGFEIAPDSRPWTTVMMPGRTQLNVQATAPNPTATRFEIWVQE
ncbi:MAG: YcfL family protein [Alcanivoracaceae bacterium]|nr:YcfL family protein [Alcanivoracaceae bacterium]